MKTILRVPTMEQYAYIEVEFDSDADGAFDEYKKLTALVKGEDRAGLSTVDWNGALDVYLETNELPDGAELYGRMSKIQQTIIQELKKSFKRTRSD